MKSLVIITMLLTTTVIASGDPNHSGSWRVRSYTDGPHSACQSSGIDLAVKSQTGEILATHRVIFKDGLHDDEWPVGNVAGEYVLEMYRIDCAGISGKVAELTTVVGALTQAKQVYVAAVVHENSYDPRYLEIDTYSEARADISVRRTKAGLLLKNQSENDLLLCGRPGIQAIRDEYYVNETWGRSQEEYWDIPEGVSSVEPGAEITLRRTNKRYLPPQVETFRPDAARVMIAIKPERPTHVALGKVPHGFIGFPGCEFIFVSRAVTEFDLVKVREVEP